MKRVYSEVEIGVKRVWSGIIEFTLPSKYPDDYPWYKSVGYCTGTKDPKEAAEDLRTFYNFSFPFPSFVIFTSSDKELLKDFKNTLTGFKEELKKFGIERISYRYKP
ncbi:MAG: hypothetical protein DRP16_01345 [Candidatus Aenigmatarchaeota archaeon]|nr:MAG: hypothetical protein DRP16_01345 [Candidatus Aenigmarchaeota archaeon]